jgi:ABC-type nitrate/sulfonate/bicarbonate transport system ATPase subunit
MSFTPMSFCRPMKMTKLRLKEISKSFSLEQSSHQVLSGINLMVHSGQFVSILGPSGCGKSTLFNIISGILRFDKGEIEIDGRKEKQLSGKCGYMFQDALLFPWKTTLQNIMLGLEVKGVDKKIAKEKAGGLLKQFNLYQYAEAHPQALSGGMKQRIALLRTIAFNSSFLLLDEPFGSLDAITRTTLHLYLLDLWEKFNSTVIFTTHDVREALFLSDKVYVLSEKPAKIVGELDNELPRPRKIEDMVGPQAAILEKELIDMLKQTSAYDPV